MANKHFNILLSNWRFIMPTVSRVTETLFDQIKASLEYADPLIVAQANHLSMKTILMIKGSQSYPDYEAQKKAQHPAQKNSSMRDELEAVNRKLDIILARSSENRLF